MMDAFNPDQPRDERGMWSGGEGGGKGGVNTWGGQRTAAGAKAAASSVKAHNSGQAAHHDAAAQAHYEASREAGFGSKERIFHEAMNEFHKSASYEASKEGARSGNDPRTASASEESLREANEIARGQRVPLRLSGAGARMDKAIRKARGSASQTANKLSVTVRSSQDPSHHSKAAAAHEKALGESKTFAERSRHASMAEFHRNQVRQLKERASRYGKK